MGPDAASAQVLAGILATPGDVVDPRTWSPGFYFGLIVGLLLLRVLVRWPASGPGFFVAELCVILPAGLFYFFVRGLVEADTARAIANAHQVVSLQRDLGIFVEPRLQRWTLDHHWLTVLTSQVYIWAHWPVIFVWVGWMWINHRPAYPVYRNAFLLSGIAGMTISALYPVAPPRLVPGFGFVDTVMLHSQAYRVLQPPALTNPYAAMPSLHFGWNLLVGVAIVQHARPLAGRLFGALLPVVMFAAIVLTANHFVLDGVVGGALALAGLAIATAWARRGVTAPATGTHEPYAAGALDQDGLADRSGVDGLGSVPRSPAQVRPAGDRRPGSATLVGGEANEPRD